MCPEDLLILISSLAIAIAKEKSEEEVAVLAAAFTTLGDALATYLAQSAFLSECCNSSDNTKNVC